MKGEVAIICAVSREDRSKSPALDRLYLDLGLGADEPCPVRVGDMAVFDRPLVQVGRRLIGKALDDRLGVAILIETLRRVRKTPHELQFAFTAQAEFGAAGSLTSAYSLDPEISLSVDVADADDGPRAGSSSISLGKGPAVRARDGDEISDPELVEWLVRRAGAARIPHQFEVAQGATCGARHVLGVRTGVRAAGISIPCRYRHTPSEMADLGDAEAAVRWLQEIARRPIDLA
jgi:endoglucanase